MQFEIKQIIPAPGWRVLLCGRSSGALFLVDSEPKIRQAVGWALCEFSNDPEDVSVHGYASKQTAVDLLVDTTRECGPSEVYPLRMLRYWGISEIIFQLGEEITEQDIQNSIADADWLKRNQERTKQEIIELHKRGLSERDIMRNTLADVSVVRGEIWSYDQTKDYQAA
jgi:hypothetical protein